MRLSPAWGKGPLWQRGRAQRVVKIGWTSVPKLTVLPSKVEVVVVEGVTGVVVLEDVLPAIVVIVVTVVVVEGVAGVVVLEDVLPAIVVIVVTVVVVVVMIPGLVSVATTTVVKPSIDASRVASPVIAHPLLPSAVRSSRAKWTAVASRHAVATGAPMRSACAWQSSRRAAVVPTLASSAAVHRRPP